MSLTYLWVNREKPSLLSSRWFIVWAKRFLQLYPLIRINSKVLIIRLKGAKVGSLSVTSNAEFEGRLVNLKIGEQTSLGRCKIVLHDRVTIGRCAVINDGVIVLTATHSLSDPQWGQKKKPTTIGDYAWIATGAIILPGVTIGRGAVVGAGAVVRENIPDFSVAIGNPSIITKDKRVRNLSYSPVLLNAPFEAWVGRNMKNINTNEKLI